MTRSYTERKYSMTEEQQQELLKIHNIYSTEELCEMFEVNTKYLNHVKRKLGIGVLSYKNDIPEGYCRCGDCKEILPEDNFYMRSKTDPSKGRYSSCKECSRIKKAIANKEKLQNRNLEKIAMFKAKYKDCLFLCKKCNKEYELNKFDVSVAKNGKISIKCNKCSSTRALVL